MQDVRRPMDRMWDGLIVLATTWFAIRVPLIWVFGASAGWSIRLADGITSGLFIADFVVQWRRVGFNARGERIMPWLELNRRQRAWLLLDLIAAVPTIWLTVNPFLLSLPLAKLPRMARLLRQWRKQAAQFGTQAKLILFVFWLALIAHWLSCGWAFLREPRPGHDEFTHYVYALYWCITTLATVGYGDLTPDTPGQMIYAMFVMIVGVGMFGYVIGNVAQWLANIDQAHTQYQSNLERLATFMQYRRIPGDLQRRIFEYYGYLWENRLVYDEFAVLAELPVPLQTEVSLILKREFIEKVPFLRGASQQLIRDLSLELRPVVFMPGDFVFHAGEIARHIYFISRGTVEVIAGDGQRLLNILSDGDFFGEIALLFHQPRSASVRAAEYCNLYALDKATFERILAHHPEFADHIQTEAQRRKDLAETMPSDATMNNTNEHQIALIELFRVAWVAVTKPDHQLPNDVTTTPELRVAMTALLQCTAARAVGFWLRCGDELIQQEFLGALDMPPDVVSGFQQATGRVAMSCVELGCVRAAAERRFVVAREDAAQRGLSGSASWLQRFEAEQSLAIPILRDGEAVAVLAIATATTFDENSATWKTLNSIVKALAATESGSL